MKIYTRKGDAGETSLYRGGRVGKDAERVNAYGAVDELNSFIGRLRALKVADEMDVWLKRVQNDLFVIGADLATPPESVKDGDRVMRIEPDSEEFLERAIDSMESELPALKQFILPGGSSSAAETHLARSVCRRAERDVIKLSRSESVSPTIIVYLNRLSDFLFVAARKLNLDQKVADEPWTGV